MNLNYIHTTEIISNLNYKTLVNKYILPRIDTFRLEDHILSELPSFLKTNKCYMFFGMFMEHAFKAIYAERQSPSDTDLGHTLFYLFEGLKRHYRKAVNCVLSQEDCSLIYSILNEFCNTYDHVLKYDDQLYDQQLLTNFGLMAQPDIISIDHNSKSLIVYEVKHSTYFPRMESKTWLQTLTYCALYQQMGYNVTDAYVLLPLNNTCLHVDVSGFDFGLYLSVLQDAVMSRLMSSISMSDMLMSALSSICSSSSSVTPYGSHVKKHTTVYKSITEAMSKIMITDSNVDTCGLQMYIRGKYSGAGKITNSDKKRSRALIQQRGLKVFAHGILALNLANPVTNFQSHINEIQDCVGVGFLGLVIHCGSNKKELNQTQDYALNLMASRIWQLMQYATESCPVILETCAGQGTDLCYNLVDFVLFYRRFGGDPRLRICVDTCHVFAAGFCPLEFINEVLRCEPGSIRLVHLNGSKKARGERVDRHCGLREGHIAFEVIQGVIDLCVEMKIPMVRE